MGEMDTDDGQVLLSWDPVGDFVTELKVSNNFDYHKENAFADFLSPSKGSFLFNLSLIPFT